MEVEDFLFLIFSNMENKGGKFQYSNPMTEILPIPCREMQRGKLN